MVIERFQQKNIFWKKEFLLSEKELTIITSHFGLSKEERKISLLEIENQIQYKRVNYLEKGCLLFVFLIITFLIVISSRSFVNQIWVLAIVLLISIILVKSVSVQYLEMKTKNDSILLYINNRNKESSKAFLEKVIHQSKELFRKKYMFVDPDISKDVQFQNYRWLLMNELINEEEYEALKKKLKETKEKNNE